MKYNHQLLDTIKSDGIKTVNNEAEWYKDKFLTEQQNERDILITELLDAYVNNYKSKSEMNSTYRKILFVFCLLVIIVFIGIYCYALINGIYHNIFGFVTLSVGVISSFIGILTIITRYIFPLKEDEYINQIVQAIQSNDFKHKRENKK